VNDNNLVARSVAGDAIAVLVSVIELRFAKKTLLDTAKDID
jgi:hypothetical protein